MKCACAAGAPFSASKRGEKTAGEGFRFPSPAPLLKNDQSGGLRPPYWMYPPGLETHNPQGEFPKMGEPRFPLFGRFQGVGCRGGLSV